MEQRVPPRPVVGLAFLFGYALTMLPAPPRAPAFGTAAGLALASDTASITIMEIVTRDHRSPSRGHGRWASRDTRIRCSAAESVTRSHAGVRLSGIAGSSRVPAPCVHRHHAHG
jgi:hypothetical protein